MTDAVAGGAIAMVGLLIACVGWMGWLLHEAHEREMARAADWCEKVTDELVNMAARASQTARDVMVPNRETDLPPIDAYAGEGVEPMTLEQELIAAGLDDPMAHVGVMSNGVPAWVMERGLVGAGMAAVPEIGSDVSDDELDVYGYARKSWEGDADDALEELGFGDVPNIEPLTADGE